MATLQDICRHLNRPLPPEISRPASFLKDEICSGVQPDCTQLQNLYNQVSRESIKYKTYQNEMAFDLTMGGLAMTGWLFGYSGIKTHSPKLFSTGILLAIPSLLLAFCGRLMSKTSSQDVRTFRKYAPAYENSEKLKHTLASYLNIN